MEETVTFESVREAYRKERNNPTLQPLEADFYQKVREYLARKKGEVKSARERGGRFGNKMVKHHETELENAMMTVQQLSQLREKKILLLALAQSSTDNKPDLDLTPVEEKFFQKILKLIEQKRKKALDKEIVPKPPKNKKKKKDESKEDKKGKEKKSEDKNLIEVEFLEDTSKFLGLDLETYGPYEKGDTASLAEELVDLLKKKGKVKPLK